MFILIAIALACVVIADVAQGQVTNSPISTMTSQIQSIAQAIATAEGFGVAGAIPTVRNNPGDITDGSGNILTFANAADGWNALYNLLQNIQAGTSKYYNTGMSWVQMGQIYAGGDPNWAVNVAASLGVDPNDTVGDYLNS